MLNFKINEDLCTQCGLCSQECPTLIINGKKGTPEIKEGKDKNCIKCQHCLAICPTGALSILKKQAKDSISVKGETPSPEALERLIKTRRSIRKFRNEEISIETNQKLIEAAACAPTGHNKNQVLLSVTDNKAGLAKVRTLVYDAIRQAVETGTLAPELSVYKNFQSLWENKNIDILFRDAPHLIVASAPKADSNSVPNCVIALSYFELLANTMGIGTLWDGLLKIVFDNIAPELKTTLGIPDDHVIGYMIVYGLPAVKYSRGIQSEGLNLNRINL